MSKSIIDFTEESDITLMKVKIKALEKGIDVSNKVKLVNYALELLSEKLD